MRRVLRASATIGRRPHAGADAAAIPRSSRRSWIMISRARPPGQHFSFAVEIEGDGMIGCVGAHAQKDGGFEIGYWFGRPYWGLGYGAEAVGAFVGRSQKARRSDGRPFRRQSHLGTCLAQVGFDYTGEITRMFSMGRGRERRLQTHALCRRGRERREARGRTCLASSSTEEAPRSGGGGVRAVTRERAPLGSLVISEGITSSVSAARRQLLHRGGASALELPFNTPS